MQQFTMVDLKVTSAIKMITSKNIIFESQFTNFDSSQKRHVLFFSYSNFDILNHSINFKKYDIMMSNSKRKRAILDIVTDNIALPNFYY